MKVKCTATKLSTEQKLLLGIRESYSPEYQLTVGATYTVLGISFVAKSEFFGSGAFLEMKDDLAPHISFVPFCLFEVVDPRPSRFWRAKSLGDCDFSLSPEEFYADYFHDELSDQEPRVVEVFDRVVEKLETEFSD